DVTVAPWAPEIVHGGWSVRLRLLIRRHRLFGARGGAVDHILQFFAGLEVRNLLGWHFHARAGLRITADARLPLACAEAAEPADLDLVAAAQCLYNTVEYRFDDDL